MQGKDINELIELAKTGDDHAFEELYERYHMQVYHIAQRICRNEVDAQDVLQETFLEVRKSLPNLRENKYFKLWLNKIVMSKCTNLFRKNKDISISPDDIRYLKHYDPLDINPDGAVRFTCDQQIVDYYITLLPKHYRDVLYDHYFKGMTMKEISQEYNVAIGTIKSRLNMGRKQLKSYLEEYETREQVTIDFSSTVLGSTFLLITLSEQGFFYRLTHHITPQITKGIIVCTISVGVVAGAFVASDLIRGDDELVHASVSSSHIANRQQVIASSAFGPIEVEGLSIQRAEDAYFKLKQWAHCEVEMKDKTRGDFLLIKPLYDELKDYRGVYWNLLESKGWIRQFEHAWKSFNE